jgi:hypothetical protein
LIQYIVVPEAHDTEPLAGQPGIAGFVGRAIQMLATVQLHDQAGGQADEIDDVGPEGKLAAKFVAIQMVHAQGTPEMTLRFSHVLAEGAGQGGELNG